MASLDDLRATIDTLDDEIVRLINRRAGAAVEIGRLKAADGIAVFSPEREKAVLDRVTALSEGPVPRHSLLAIYRELMSASFALERPPRVAFLGPRGSYSHEAALGKFGSSVEYEPVADVRSVFDEIVRGHVNYGVVPVENRSAGAVLDTLDAFVDCDVHICNEIQRAIHHQLMAKCRLDEIEVVYSKPEALAQCKLWLMKTELASKTSPAPSTSRAAQLAAAEPRAAAIGSRMASQLYEIPVIATNIEDQPKNATRFFVLGAESSKPTGADRTSLLFVTANRAGALAEVLLVFQKHGLNMTMITSRPGISADAEYNFFVDVDGHVDEPATRAAVDEASGHCQRFRILGSYPRATEVVAA